MSQQGLQKVQQVLQILGTQLPSIAQAHDTPGIVNLFSFLAGVVQRHGVPLDEPIANLLGALTVLIGELPQIPAPPPDYLPRVPRAESENGGAAG